MSESTMPDNEDTISVPLPVPPPEPEPTEEQEIQQAERSLTDIHAAMEVMGRTLAVTTTAFEELKRVVFGDEKAMVHACPPGTTEKLPCCGRSMIDVPLTERISLDGSEVTCGRTK